MFPLSDRAEGLTFATPDRRHYVIDFIKIILQGEECQVHETGSPRPSQGSAQLDLDLIDDAGVGKWKLII